jgi:glycosyltransferase involved in cell wall biosynthesis
MDISVIICTYNRADSLFRTLESLHNQELDRNVSGELIVVDNNSSDRTADVVARFSDTPTVALRYLLEQRQGKSYALNTGVAAARGEILAFTDDDVVADRGWLQAIWNASRAHDARGFGGKILPFWICRKPGWVVMQGPYANAFGKLVVHDFGDAVLDYARVGLLAPAGANMFFRKEVFSEHGGFDERLGLFGNKRIGQVDTEFCRRLIGRGETLLYVPQVVVWHVEEPDRLTKRYFRSWHFRHGRTDVMREPMDSEAVRYFGVPRYLLTQIAREALRWASYMVTMRPIAAFVFELRTIHWLGQATEHFDLWRRNRRARAAASAHAACRVN